MNDHCRECGAQAHEGFGCEEYLENPRKGLWSVLGPARRGHRPVEGPAPSGEFSGESMLATLALQYPEYAARIADLGLLETFEDPGLRFAIDCLANEEDPFFGVGPDVAGRLGRLQKRIAKHLLTEENRDAWFRVSVERTQTDHTLRREAGRKR